MTDLALTPSNSPTAKRRGRPPGARNRRSLDLGRYIEAKFNGSTPGQQSADLCLVTAKELKAAGGDLVFAMVMKAKELADYLRCTDAEAWVLLAKERMELMAYVHQKQPQAKPIDASQIPLAFIVPDGAQVPLLELLDADEEALGNVDVTSEKSSEDGQDVENERETLL